MGATVYSVDSYMDPVVDEGKRDLPTPSKSSSVDLVPYTSAVAYKQPEGGKDTFCDRNTMDQLLNKIAAKAVYSVDPIN